MTVRAPRATIATAVVATAIAAGVVRADGSNEPWRGKPHGTERSVSARGQGGNLPSRSPVGVVSRTLARLDPLTLTPREPRLELGEFHETWSFSPDRSRVALGMGSPSVPTCGAGICIVDLASMRIVEDIDGSVAAEAVGWVSPRRVVAILQSGEVLVGDPETGETLPGHDLSAQVLAPTSAATPNGFAVVLGGNPSRLAEFDRRARMRVADLERIRLRDRKPFPTEAAGLAVDRAGRRALVFAAGAPAAEVNLETMEVRYEPVSMRAPGRGAAGEAGASIRSADWLGSGLVAVSGSDWVRDRTTTFDNSRPTPAGVKVIDTETWTAQMVNRRATGAARAAGRLLAWSSPGVPRGSGIGLRIYTRSGRRLLAHRFGDETLTVQVVGGYAYVLGAADRRDRRGRGLRLRVVRVRSGRVVHRSDRPGAHVLLLSCRLGSAGQCVR
jgi:hypothetical protein